MQKTTFIGYGELTWDKNFDVFLKLIKENGGGTTWNILSNLAIMNSTSDVYAIGVCGNDKYGDRAIEALRQSDVNVEFIEKRDKPTNIVYSIIPQEIKGDSVVKYSMKSPLTSIDGYKLAEDLPNAISEQLKNEFVIIVLENFRKQNLEFVNNFKNKKIALDIGRARILEDYSKEYLLKFLQNIDITQISGEVLNILYQKLEINSVKELFLCINPDLLIVTNGSKRVTFAFKEGNKVVQIEKNPEIVHDVTDTTGAGDSFFSAIINAYSIYIKNNKKIDESFIDKIFPIANTLSGEAIKQIGGRCERTTIENWFKKINTKVYVTEQDYELN